MATKKASKTVIAASIGAALNGGSEIPAELVTAAANVNGAKQGKDAVPAGKDYSKTLAELATTELGFIQKQVNLQGDRMVIWQSVAKLAESAFRSVDGKTVNVVLSQYPKVLRGKLLEAAGLKRNSEGEFPARESWPVEVTSLYERHLSKRLAETKKVMGALDSQFTLTKSVLDGKGSIHQKLVALPNLSTKGRKKGSTGSEKGKGSKDATGSDALKSIAASLKDLSFDGLLEVALLLEKHGKTRKEYQSGGASMNFIESLKVARLHYETEITKAETAKGRKTA